MTKYSKKLSRQVIKLDGRNKKLVFQVKKLQRDSLQLSKILENTLSDNQRLVKAYELRIQGMAGELRSLHDSLSDLRIVKRDLDLIKNYFSTARLAKREYDLPVNKVIEILNDLFLKSTSPYKVKSKSEQELVITENFVLKRQTLLFIKANIHMHGEYKIIMKPHPFDEEKTLVDLRNNFQRKRGNDFINDTTFTDYSEAERRLFDFIDKSIF